MTPHIDARAFPTDFTWGVATSAYQIEGAVAEGGRTPSIWDTFSARAGRTVDGDTGEIAVDHYHRWAQDVDLMSDLGVGSYRFSIAWPRIQPHGRGPANPEGVDFYSRLVDRLLERGITPWATLYHWDLPDELEQAGGWPVRDTAYRFAEFAGLVADALGDRVSDVITINEPWCAAFLGYGNGRHAPGRSDASDAVDASHHLLLGHGLAVQAVRERVPDARIGITLNLYPVSPASDADDADDAVRRIDGLANRWFLDPVLRGSYPKDVVEDLRTVTDMSVVQDTDLETIAAPMDFLGVNYYTRHVVASGAFPGSGHVEFRSWGRPRTATGWEIDPDGLTETLARVHRDYPTIAIYVTENGAAFDDAVSTDGVVHDQDRVDFLRGHLEAAGRAIAQGVPLQGYFAWSLLDNFEWSEGYAKRFGIVHVDYDTQVRTVKDSGRWYSSLVRAHRDGYSHHEPAPPTAAAIVSVGAPSHPTLEQVAARAGVGRGTASRVINGSPHVSSRTRDAVLKAVADLGYVPNQAARSLVTRRTGAIALVISESEERLFGEPFFAGVVRGISAVISDASRQLVLTLVQSKDQGARLDSYLTPQHVDGVLMLSQHDDDVLPHHLQTRGIPTVHGGRPTGIEHCSYVDVDNIGGAGVAVEHLLARGHTSVATITGPPDMTAGRDRYAGYVGALTARGIEVDADLVVEGDFSENSGVVGMRTLLERRPDLDAVFVASDPMAAGALRALREAGRAVPRDVAVVGFDDAPMAAVTEPALTTVHQPAELFGREMGAMLLDRIQRIAAGDDGDRSLILPTHLVERDSS